MKPLRSVLITVTIYWQFLGSLSKLRIDFDQLETMTEELASVLGNCKLPEVRSIVVLRDSNESIKWTAKSLNKVSLINLKNTNSDGQFSRSSYWRQKLRTFVIMTPYKANLRYLIKELRNSIWWNPSALYILIDDRTAKTGCDNARRFLRTAWKENLLSSTFFCIDPAEGFEMHTYNPFTKRAPKPWQEVSTNEDHQNPWTLFKRTFIPGLTSCENLNFDKTRTLDGYPIKIIGLESRPLLTIDLDKKGIEAFGGFDGRIAQSIWTKLNASLIITAIRNCTHTYKYIPEVSAGVYDILMNTQYIFNKPNTSMTYPYINEGISMVTRFPGFEAGYRKILKYMNPKLLIGAFLISTITAIILGVCTKRGFLYASLEVLRMMLGVAILRLPRGNPLRTYLATVLILFMLTASTFEGNLSSLLTTPIPKQLINCVTDLKKSGYPIYMFRGYKNAIHDETIYSRLRLIDHWDCTEYVLKYPNVACAADRAALMKVAFEKKLHLSRHRALTLYSGYVVRRYWPLKSTINRILSRMVQSGLTDRWWEESVSLYKQKWLRWIKYTEKREYHVMTLGDLTFAFYILLTGIGLSVLVFVIELSWQRVCGIKRRERVVLPFVP